jgi:uridine kinase
MRKPVVIGIAGGTGSGKSTVAKEIYRTFDESCIAVLEQDSYYKDQSNLTFEERVKTNYDHPNAFDNDLLVYQLKELISGRNIEKPVYDFSVHNRAKETVHMQSKDIIMLEGILILEEQEVRDLLDIKIYVDTDADIRILRRIVRDIEERGRTLDSVINQYLEVVRPMHLQFAEPTKRYADIIFPEGGRNKVAIDIIVTKIQQILNDKIN